MDSRHRIKAAAATLTVGFLLAIAFAGPIQAGNGTPKGTSAQELKALQARSDAWNRFYHLGAYSSAVASAEKRRAQATNEYYRAGRYTVISVSSPFDWGDAGIGAGALLGVLMVAGGLTVAVRRRAGGKTSFPSTT